MSRRVIWGLAICGLVLADGGKVQFRKQAGPFEITLFSAPNPLRVGTADLSVMVRTAHDQQTVMDAHVQIHFIQQVAGHITEVVAPATHERATNKLLYAAKMDLPKDGSWHAEVEVKRNLEAADVSGQIDVLPPQAPLVAHWPYFALLPVLLLLFAANQWLKQKRRKAVSPPTRPSRRYGH